MEEADTRSGAADSGPMIGGATGINMRSKSARAICRRSHPELPLKRACEYLGTAESA